MSKPKVYESSLPSPHIPRVSVFHYLFPPKKKGKHVRFYPPPDPTSIGFVEAETGRELLREEIPTRSMWLSAGLRRMGVGRKSVGCIFGMNSLEWVEACFGLQAAGAIVSPANYGYTSEELLHQLADSGASCVFVQPALIPVLEKTLALTRSASSSGTSYTLDPSHIILLCQYSQKPQDSPYRCVSELWDKQAIPRQFIADDEKEPAYLCYSSGTTGRAKGVETSHHNMTSQIQAVNTVYEPLFWNVRQRDIVLGVLPFGHMYGLTFLVHQPLTRGVPVIVMPKFDLEEVLKAIEKYKVTFMLVVPPMVIAMLNSPLLDEYDISTLRGVMTGAAPCSSDVIAAFEARFPKVRVDREYGKPPNWVPACRVAQGYGLTETSPVTHVMSIEEGVQHVGKIGRIMPTMQARLVDFETGHDVEQGERGELWLRGPSVMRGYWKNDEATKNTFASGGWFKTGDVATVDHEGYFAIVDRVKELIKYKGYQVPPAELESLLLTHHKVADAGVIGIYSDAQATELPRAYVVPKGGSSGLSDAKQAEFSAEVIKWVEGKVANHKRLRGGVKLIEVVPKSPSGKILRKTLREMAKQEGEAVQAKHEGGTVEAKL